MPIYEFECEECGERFEELVAADAAGCLSGCGSARTRRLISTVSPPGASRAGPRVRSDESRRREREAAGSSGSPSAQKRRRAKATDEAE